MVYSEKSKVSKDREKGEDIKEERKVKASEVNAGEEGRKVRK